jgi:hypothetical protein
MKSRGKPTSQAGQKEKEKRVGRQTTETAIHKTASKASAIMGPEAGHNLSSNIGQTMKKGNHAGFRYVSTVQHHSNSRGSEVEVLGMEAGRC